MPSRWRPWIIMGVILAVLLSAAPAVRAQQPSAETATVSKTYNNCPFEYCSRLLVERAAFRVYRLTYPSPVVTSVEQNNTVPADYYLPKCVRPDGPKCPAVICLHILDGNEELTDLVCSVLAGRGVPAISFKLPYYGERGLPRGPEELAGDPKLFVGAIAQTGQDIRRTVDLLASRGEIDPERIDITGISLGGIIAATAAGAEPRLHRTGLILSGGDLLQIIHHARETRPLSETIQELSPPQRAELEANIEAADPLKFASALRDRALAGKVLMINAAQDEVIPRQCTEKLAAALGISDRVVWLEGLGHYTAMAELPRALRMTADFFAQDLPAEVSAATAPPVAAEPTALQRLVAALQQAIAMLGTEPDPGRCHFADLELSVSGNAARPIEAQARLARGRQGRFLLRCQLPEIGEVALGQGRFPWLLAGGKALFVGAENPRPNADPLAYADPRHLMMLKMAAGVAGSIAMAPEMLQQWINVEDDASAAAARAIQIRAKDAQRLPGQLRLAFQDDGRTPAELKFAAANFQATIRFRGWQTNTVAVDALFDPPEGPPRREVAQADLLRVFAAMFNFAAERTDFGDGLRRATQPEAISVVARDPAGHGLLCRQQGKTILLLSGTPVQMGAAHGALLGAPARKMTERVLYLVGGGDTLRSGQWFFDRMADIERRTTPHIPPRFFDECDALAQAACVSQRDARYANLFPERFHCSGVALRGKATADGRVLHARVLDYMREIDLQEAATVTVFMPEGFHKWMSLGYAGFIGTVTAMNECGLAIGEMGGRGEGQWDGIPMSLLLRDVMERAATVDEALAILRDAPRTCEYYYVLSDRSGSLRALHCTPQQMTALEPGQQHARLPLVPEDVVLASGEDRATVLSRRIQENYGRINVPKLIEIIKRPVAMESNLHDAIFAPETLEMWFADAGRSAPACDEPYVRVNLRDVIRFYADQKGKTGESAGR